MNNKNTSENSTDSLICLDDSLPVNENPCSNVFRKSKDDNEVQVIKETSCCPLCFELVETNLESHFALKHKELDCPFCERIFDTDSELSKHLETAHHNYSDHIFKSSLQPAYQASKESNEVEDFECPVCLCKIKNKQLLENHVESHFNTQIAKINDAVYFNENDKVSFNDKEAENMDYQLAISVHNEEIKKLNAGSTEEAKTSASITKSSISSDQNFIKSQLVERKRNEALKYKMSKGIK